MTDNKKISLTVQHAYSNESGYNHSWFVGFSNTGENDIVVVVLFEEALPGEAPALAVARSIFVNYFNR
jgi:peptidoglycan glycosyltransferase